MSTPSPSVILAAHLLLLSSVSFGGFPTVLPDVRDLAAANGWLDTREFADLFAISQVMPGPNMILMMSLIGLKLGGIAGAMACALATFGPPCAMYYASFRIWDRFRHMPWQRIVRGALTPVTVGLVVASGCVMAGVGDVGWRSIAVTAAAAALLLWTRINPLWILAAGGTLGGLGLLQL